MFFYQIKGCVNTQICSYSKFNKNSTKVGSKLPKFTMIEKKSGQLSSTNRRPVPMDGMIKTKDAYSLKQVILVTLRSFGGVSDSASSLEWGSDLKQL